MTKTIKIVLLTGIAAAALSTPLLASHNMGLRGAHAPQTYGHQYHGQTHHGQHHQSQQQGYTFIAPQARPYYMGHVVSDTYQIQPQRLQQTAHQPHYVQTLPSHHGQHANHHKAVPVGDYRYASLNSNLGLRGSRNMDRSFDVGGANVRTSVAHTKRMLDWQENTTGKSLTLLANKYNGTLAPNSLTLGGAMKGAFMWQKTDTPGQFPILSRFPDFSPSTDTEAGVFAINNAALAITGTFGDWTSFYLQPEYSETEFFGQSEFQLRKAFVVFGNLEKTPFYAAFGRKTIDFGNFDGYNAFTHTEAQHYFWAASDQPVLELGYYDINSGLKLTASAFSGGRQLRVAYAQEENNIANYAASIEKEFRFGGDKSFTVGTSYLHDTIYRNNFTAHTFGMINSGTPPANFIQYRNSAVDAFAEYNSDFFDLMFEYTTTLEPWAAAIPQDAAGNVDPAYLDADGNITFDQNLEVFTAQARIKPMLPNGRRMAIAAVGSWGNIGDDFQGTGFGGTPTSWEKNQQHALSIEYPINDYLEVGAEYVYNKGFIPFVAPQLVSNDETEAHAINIGFKARF